VCIGILPRRVDQDGNLPGFDRPPDSRNNATEVDIAASTDISLTDMRDAEKHPPLIDRQSASIRSRSRQVTPKQPTAAAAEDCSLRQALRCLLKIAGLRRSINLVWIGILSRPESGRICSADGEGSAVATQRGRRQEKQSSSSDSQLLCVSH
jgi:hypothetical protein